MTPRLLRTAAAAAVMAAAGFAASWALPLIPGAATCAAAGYTSRAALVVQHSDGSAIRLCIGFDGTGINGEQILRASGLEYATATYPGLGDAVCQIDSEPATYPPGCWTTTSPYWVTFVSRGGGTWSGADHGVSTEVFHDGDAEGFRYDPQSGAALAPPSPAGVCAVAGGVGASSPAATIATPKTAPSTGSAGASPAPASAGVTPAPGVVANARPALRPGVTPSLAATRPSAQPGLNPGLLLASVALGALCGLAVVRQIRRRRT